jgi:Arc/MetJ family transcription regulator
MKRTSLVLDDQLLNEALRISGEKTLSGTVDRALREFVAHAKARNILNLRGSGLWEGDLSEMRDDRKPRGREHSGRR